MGDNDFADEFINSEDTVESYISLIKNGGADLPSKEQLARAALCLMFSLPEYAKPRQAWDVIHLLASPEAGVSLYSIKPQINELLVLARNNVDKIMERSNGLKHSDGSDDLF